MAFWGVELRPGSTYSHRYHPSDGRLRVTQAALINCDVATRTLVQCTVGNKMPLTICSLNPTLSDMCHLEVEFEEDVNVLFSVVGPSAVHLSGYYLRNSISNRNIARDQPSSESYEEYIGESDSEYSYESEEGSNLSDFIDDADVETFYSMDDGDVCFSHDRHRPEPELEKQKKSKKTPLETEDGNHSNNIRTFEDGLIIEDLSAGNRDAKVASKGNKVYINYVGKLQDGRIVHSNAGEKLYKFMLGSEKVIRGWDLGILGMGVGDKRTLTIPPSLRGIGAGPVGKSSKYSTIIYEVELVEVR